MSILYHKIPYRTTIHYPVYKGVQLAKLISLFLEAEGFFAEAASIAAKTGFAVAFRAKAASGPAVATALG